MLTSTLLLEVCITLERELGGYPEAYPEEMEKIRRLRDGKSQEQE